MFNVDEAIYDPCGQQIPECNSFIITCTMYKLVICPLAKQFNASYNHYGLEVGCFYTILEKVGYFLPFLKKLYLILNLWIGNKTKYLNAKTDQTY